MVVMGRPFVGITHLTRVETSPRDVRMHIVTIDLNMPGMGGQDLIRRVHEEFPNVELEHLPPEIRPVGTGGVRRAQRGRELCMASANDKRNAFI